MGSKLSSISDPKEQEDAIDIMEPLPIEDTQALAHSVMLLQQILKKNPGINEEILLLGLKEVITSTILYHWNY